MTKHKSLALILLITIFISIPLRTSFSVEAFKIDTGNFYLKNCKKYMTMDGHKYANRSYDDIASSRSCYYFFDGVVEGYLTGSNDSAQLAYENLSGIKTSSTVTWDDWEKYKSLFEVCMPKDVTYGQSQKAFITFLEDNPKLTHKHTSSLIILSLKDAFPCHNK